MSVEISMSGVKEPLNHDEGEESSESTESGQQSQAETVVERDSWDNKFQYLMAALGFAVGLGNIWRFPYLCKKNGGGAFLIPYVLMLFILGYPLYYLELALGQKVRKGTIGVWSHINPYLGGIGFASNIISLLIGLYYTMILGWAFFYFFNSFVSPLPWSECPVVTVANVTRRVEECELSSPTNYFWYRQTLDISDTVEEGFGQNWRMVLMLLLAWFLVFLGIVRGIKSSGKVMYFATSFPYLVLFAFFCRGVTLDGALDGVKYMFSPDLDRLSDPTVWREAATQIFFSLGLGYGTIIAYSSYNNPKNNCMNDAIFIASANCLTSLFACITVFTILGFKAKQSYLTCVDSNQMILDAMLPGLNMTGTDSIVGMNRTLLASVDAMPDETNITAIVAQLRNCSVHKELDQDVQGTGLAFIAFAEAVLKFPFPNLWSFLFFSMLVSIGISSEFGILQTVITTVLDSGIRVAKWKITGLMCSVLCLLGLLFTCRSGSYMLDIFDGYSATLGLAAICLFEVLAVSYAYDIRKFKSDLREMVGVEPNKYFEWSWRFTSPLALIVILISSIYQLCTSKLQYGAWKHLLATKVKTAYPGWAVALIVILLFASSVCMPLVALLYKYGIFKPKNFGIPQRARSASDPRQVAVTESTFPLTEKA